MGLEFKLKVFGRELEGNPFFKRVSLVNTFIRSDYISIFKPCALSTVNFLSVAV